MGVDWVLVGAVVGGVVFVVLTCIFVKDEPDDDVGVHNPDPGWRDRKAQATSYWEMAEYRDSIEDGR